MMAPVQTVLRIFIRMLILALGSTGSLSSVSAISEGHEIVWPTPNPAVAVGGGLETFIQPTISGRLESGLWGCVRNGGHRFHEGLDLKALQRDRRNEATDRVFAVMSGRVAHINHVAGHSSYGRYVVIEHTDYHPSVYTLYAHLARTEPGLEIGQSVKAGQPIAVMGRSAGGYTIPRSRAHLHFEIGLRLSDDFQEWYDDQGFGSKNHHGNFNGMNLIGWNPLDYYRKLMSGSAVGPASFIEGEPTGLSLRIFTGEVPDLLRRCPALIAGGLKNKPILAWDIDFTWYGMPKNWVPRYAEDGIDGNTGTLQLLFMDRQLLESHKCKSMLDFHAGDRVSMGDDLRNILEILFEMY